MRSVFPESWEESWAVLRDVDLSIFNPDWEGGILLKAGIFKSRASVGWMRDYLKNRLGLGTGDGSRAGRPCHNQGG